MDNATVDTLYEHPSLVEALGTAFAQIPWVPFIVFSLMLAVFTVTTYYLAKKYLKPVWEFLKFGLKVAAWMAIVRLSTWFLYYLWTRVLSSIFSDIIRDTVHHVIEEKLNVRLEL